MKTRLAAFVTVALLELAMLNVVTPSKSPETSLAEFWWIGFGCGAMWIATAWLASFLPVVRRGQHG